MAVPYDSTDSYDNTSYSYVGAIYRTATGAGTSSSSASWYAFDPTDQYDEATITYDQADVNYFGKLTVSQDGTGLGFATSITQTNIIRPRIGAVSGAGTSSASGLGLLPRSGSASATGTSTSQSNVVWFRSGSSSGVSSQLAAFAIERLRTAYASGGTFPGTPHVYDQDSTYDDPELYYNVYGTIGIGFATHPRTAIGDSASNSEATNKAILARTSTSAGTGTHVVVTLRITFGQGTGTGQGADITFGGGVRRNTGSASAVGSGFGVHPYVLTDGYWGTLSAA